MCDSVFVRGGVLCVSMSWQTIVQVRVLTRTNVAPTKKGSHAHTSVRIRQSLLVYATLSERRQVIASKAGPTPSMVRLSTPPRFNCPRAQVQGAIKQMVG